jgi:hypothetical protein
MKQEDVESVIKENVENLLGEYGAQVRAASTDRASALSKRIARAAVVEAKRPVQPRLTPSTILDVLFTGRRGFATAGAIFLLALFSAAYILFGGRSFTPEIQARLGSTGNGAGVQIAAAHYGPLGLTWQLPLPFYGETAMLSIGDEIQTNDSTSLTLTFPNGSTSIVAPNAVVRIDSLSPVIVNVKQGELSNSVKHADAPGAIAFEVLTNRARYTVRGTAFSVHVGSALDQIKTTEGQVAVTTPKNTQTVSQGQQADVSSAGTITRQLLPPDLTLTLSSRQIVQQGATVATNVRQAELRVHTAPGARVEVFVRTSGQAPIKLATAQAGPTGDAISNIALPSPDGQYELFARATDDAEPGISPAASRPIVIQVDRTSPSLFKRLEPASSMVTTSPLQIVGQVEPGTRMTVNGMPAVVQTDGSFSVELQLQSGSNAIRFIITDAAGNVLRIEETLYLQK